ncbi:MAG TPA: Nif3-like dinuclear metal center hexameric protein [Saprospiraceae bacterium]|nr:Nif3-like dinuclear metal center hexameric protein [Saprospiraceae bacterium]
MATVKELYDYLDFIAPLRLQMNYDNAGLLTGRPDIEIEGVLVSLDCTEDIIDEAVRKDCNVVVCHHPIIFKGLKQLTGDNYVERTVIKAIKQDVCIMAWHTNLDSVLINGVNSQIAERLNLQKPQILQPAGEDPEIGSGMIGELPQAMNRKDFFAYLAQKMELKTFKYTKGGPEYFKKVALCGGAGSFLINAAQKADADIYLTGDVKYHEFFDGEQDLCILDIGHYESEKYTIELMYTLISQKFSTFALQMTEQNTNPIEFYQ